MGAEEWARSRSPLLRLVWFGEGEPPSFVAALLLLSVALRLLLVFFPPSPSGLAWLSLEGWMLSCSAVRSCVRSLAVASWPVFAVAGSKACGGVASPWSMGRVSHHGLRRTAWLGDGSGCGRCHAHSAHVIASLGNVGVEVDCW